MNLFKSLLFLESDSNNPSLQNDAEFRHGLGNGAASRRRFRTVFAQYDVDTWVDTFNDANPPCQSAAGCG